ncbi:Hypothetical predicted protein [Mytilus galloprovincialis]|uniref:Uncharacterized protein n=1 Tax=Mytilus galloprovincialis TaxID=29158 RepID=A0A8B6FW77_MYTGA|nr:Hypothetical predicted protein [Mytilus galloprovincialis]
MSGKKKQKEEKAERLEMILSVTSNTSICGLDAANNSLVRKLSSDTPAQEIIQYLHESDMKNVVPKKLDDFDKIVVSMVCTSFNQAGKHLRDCSVIVVDRYGYLRLEMEKDHLNLVQHSQIRTDECRAIGDISDSLKQWTGNPSFNEIIAVLEEKYFSGYEKAIYSSCGRFIQ